MAASPRVPSPLPADLTLVIATFGGQWTEPRPRTLRTFDIRGLVAPKGHLKGMKGTDTVLQEKLLEAPGAREKLKEISDYAESVVSGRFSGLDGAGTPSEPATPAESPNGESWRGPRTLSALNSATSSGLLDPMTDTDTDLTDTDPSSPNLAAGAPPVLPKIPSPAIGIMCDHGRHRSVAMAELVKRELAKRGIEVLVIHRDLGRGKTNKEKRKTEERLKRERETTSSNSNLEDGVL